MHGAPGSQNVSMGRPYPLSFDVEPSICTANKQGFDNSGVRGSANWANDQRNIDRTRGVVQSLAGEFSSGQYYGVVTAIVSGLSTVVCPVEAQRRFPVGCSQ